MNRDLAFAFPMVLLGALSAACSSADTSSSTFTPAHGSSNDGDDGGAPGLSLGGGGGTGGSAPSSASGSSTLTAIIRDFKLYDAANPTTNPDFEHVPATDANGNPNASYTGPWDDRGIVLASLGADGKPVYAHGAGGTLTTHGAASFDQWYRDVAGTNVRVEYPIALTSDGAGTSSFDSEKTGAALSASDPTKMFFPIDDGTPYATPFGDQGDPHDYAFTVEMHTVFTYAGGESFTFRGDDDVFVYVAGKLAIDLGGIHGAEPAAIQLDALGLTKGQEYPLDFFSAERHKTGSNVLFTTTLGLRPATPK